MKYLFYWSLFLCFNTTILWAQEPQEIPVASEIEAVTVYKRNARITRTAKTNVPAGTSELVLQQLSQKLLINSIQVKLSNKQVALISAVPRINYLEKNNLTERYKILDDSIVILQRELADLKVEQGLVTSTKSVLMSHDPLGTAKDKGYSIEEIKALMDFRRKELSQLEREALKLSYQQADIEANLRKYQIEQNQIRNTGAEPTGELVLKVQTASKAATDIEVTYVVTSAGWEPLYDLKSDGVGEPLALTYKAKVHQSTGYDWKKVKLNLSSSDPSMGHDRPILNPMRLNLTDVAVTRTQKKGKKAGQTYIQYQGTGNVILEQQVQRKTLIQAQTITARDIERIPNRSISSISATTAGVNQLDRGESINSNGSRASSNDTYIDGVRVIGTLPIPEGMIMEDFIEEEPANINFDLELLQSIPTDGDPHIVEVKEYEVPVTYEYHVVPKMDKGVFLLAKITNYGKYNLLPGQANIFFDDVYLGQSFLNSNITMDTLLLSLGRDEKITVRREKMKSVQKEQGNFIKETLAFDISVRNNKAQAIEISILDQVPISKNKDLEVKLIESTSARYYKPYGSLRWRKKIKPNMTEKVSFEYEVKYPKDRGIVKAP